MSASQRHKCFISYHRADQREVDKFIEAFDSTHDILIHRAVREMNQNIIDSNDPDYVMRRIRELYLADSTVTIVLLGESTWARRYVDWEIASTLRNDSVNRRSGLMAITLPSMADKNILLPPRFADNCDGDDRYARWWKYPTDINSLVSMIEDAFQARESRSDLIDNTRKLFGYDRSSQLTRRVSEPRTVKGGSPFMEPMTFILGLASSILGSMLSDFITGKSQSARRAEIEQQVSASLLRQSQEQNQDLRHMLQDVMREIEILSTRDPDLKVTDDEITLKKPITKPLLSFNRDRLLQKQLTSRLNRLEQIITQRREELGLPTTPDQTVHTSSATLGSTGSERIVPPGWEYVGEPRVESNWTKAIKETEDKIRRRRSGGTL